MSKYASHFTTDHIAVVIAKEYVSTHASNYALVYPCKHSNKPMVIVISKSAMLDILNDERKLNEAFTLEGYELHLRTIQAEKVYGAFSARDTQFTLPQSYDDYNIGKNHTRSGSVEADIAKALTIIEWNGQTYAHTGNLKNHKCDVMGSAGDTYEVKCFRGRLFG